jgi:PAS domain S-box-containing protein
MVDKVNINDSNAFFKLLFQSIEEGLIITNSQGIIIDVNNRTQELFGYSKEELTDQTIEILIPKKYRPNHHKNVEAYGNNPTKKRMGQGRNLQGVKKNGEIFFTEISLNHLEIKNEKYFVAFVTDITNRIDAENAINNLNKELEQKVETRTKELQESQKLYTAIVENFPHGIIKIIDKDLKYIFADGQELKKSNIQQKDLIGTDYLDGLTPEIASQLKNDLAIAFNGNIAEIELEYKNEHYHITAVPLASESGEIDKALLVETNITERKKASIQLKNSLKKEKEINEMKSRFVSMASHQFRTPLSTILSSISLVDAYTNKNQPEKVEKHVKRIKNSVKGLTNILNDFLSSDTLESQNINTSLSIIDYSKFVNDITDDLQQICKDDQLIISSIKSDNSIIKTDPHILRNIVSNLISNSIKYSDEGKEIRFVSSIKGDALKIDITDEGIGIPEEEQSKLFGQFYRASNAQNHKGTGLGLHIVKQYLELLGGTINFMSKPNVGSTFTLKIPINHE